MDRRKLLEQVEIFGSLDGKEIDYLLDITTTKKLARREVLFRKGELGNQLYGILSGRVKVTSAGADGKEVVFNLMGAGEIIGEIALVDDLPRSATITAIEPCVLLVLHRRDILPFLETHPKVALQIAEVLAARVRRLSEHAEDALFLTLPSRTAKVLLSLAKNYGQPTEAGVRIDVRLAQKDLADMVGTTRETINKQLKGWEHDGLVKVERTRITILEKSALESIAELSPSPSRLTCTEL